MMYLYAFTIVRTQIRKINKFNIIIYNEYCILYNVYYYILYISRMWTPLLYESPTYIMYLELQYHPYYSITPARLTFVG